MAYENIIILLLQYCNNKLFKYVIFSVRIKNIKSSWYTLIGYLSIQDHHETKYKCVKITVVDRRNLQKECAENRQLSQSLCEFSSTLIPWYIDMKCIYKVYYHICKTEAPNMSFYIRHKLYVYYSSHVPETLVKNKYIYTAQNPTTPCAQSILSI